MVMRNRKQNKQKDSLRFPITARQAQKLLAKGGDTTTLNLLLAESEELKTQLAKVMAKRIDNCLEKNPHWSRARVEKSLIKTSEIQCVLAKLSAKNPNLIVVPDAGASESDYEDCDYEDYDDGEAEADTLDSQYAPKGTDEVAPQSDSPSDDAEMHGGENASQEVEDGHAQGGEQSSNNSETWSQSTGTDEGAGQGSGLNLEDCDAGLNNQPSDGRPETGSATSGDADTTANPQTPAPEQAGTSEEATSELGEGTATSPMSETDGKTMQAVDSDSPRDGESEAETQENSDFGESQGGDSFKLEGQAKSLEDVIVTDDDATQGQSGDSEEWKPSLADDDAIASEANQVSDDVPQHQKKWGKSFSKHERKESKLSVSANSNHGGINSSLANAGISPKLAKECQRKLAKLIGDATTETSPRRDYQEFCVRVKTFRNPNPARKEESGRPVILIMADVSGSCSSFSDQSVMVAKAASKLGVQGSDVIVLTHSNGYPHELEHNGKAVDVSDIAVRSRRHENAIWYDALMQKYQIAVGIALGDWDAANEYTMIMQHPNCERFIWLDNAFCSSRGFVKNETKSALQGLSRYTQKISQIRHKLTYKTGCKDAKAFVKEIE